MESDKGKPNGKAVCSHDGSRMGQAAGRRPARPGPGPRNPWPNGWAYRGRPWPNGNGARPCPAPGNLLALRQCLGGALPEPPEPAGEGAAESAAVEMPQAAGDAAKAGAPAAGASPEPAAPKGTGKWRNSRPWLVALAVLCVVFCLLSLVTYVFTAVAGAYLLLVTVAAVAAWAVVCKVRGQSAAPALWAG